MLEKLEVIFWDVGQGNCTTFKLPDESVVIIDTGRKTSPLAGWLRRNKPRIYALIATHCDVDHCGAFPTVVNEHLSRIDNIWFIQDRPYGEGRYQDLFRVVDDWQQSTGRTALELKYGMRPIWRSDDGRAVIEVISPTMVQNQKGIVSKSGSAPNLSSAIITFTIDDKCIIALPSDATLARTIDCLEKLKPRYIYIPHHGAPKDFSNKKTRDVLKKISPHLGFVSVGSTNGDKHPKARLLRRLAYFGNQIFCSQLTERCDSRKLLEMEPLVSAHMATGLRLPKTKTDGLSCRGPMKFVYDDEEGLVEKPNFSERHRERIIEREIQRPCCILQKRHFNFLERIRTGNKT